MEELRPQGFQANVITYSAAISACDKMPAMGAGLKFVVENVALSSGVKRNQLQRSDQRLREGPVVEATRDQQRHGDQSV